MGKVDLSRVYLGTVLQQQENITPQMCISDPSQNNFVTQEHHRNPVPTQQLDSLEKFIYTHAKDWRGPSLHSSNT